jgi:ATP-dependent Clp protease protease subunit
MMERDKFMGAQEALDIGIVDQILEKRTNIVEKEEKDPKAS